MNVVQRVEHWGDTHHPAWIDALRIMLGITLFLKGVSFISDTGHLTNLVGGTRFDLIPMFLIHYVAFAHLVGGLLIAMGCLTRLSVLIQLPILIGAVFFVNVTRGFSALNSELWLSVVVLLLLLVFLVLGSGRFSVDEYMRKHDH
ncbi:DoxX family protein [Larkinella arboricola]|uniref:Putative membrane protein YphA (DoxX/SURF4 family) n=1 Tax=Larkinella arboricola TaxID=643671 RepID=A0A327WKF0_LARAB|nr:DoxX family protein [Larkinella arboricola]RAJ92109.1 putative membrane protein YphA (DoxX/SURF4 family) [Larkinella arboricola]